MPECLICHQRLRHAGLHLIRKHGVSPKEYKARFGPDVVLIDPECQVQNLVEAKMPFARRPILQFAEEFLGKVPGEKEAFLRISSYYLKRYPNLRELTDNIAGLFLVFRIRELRGLELPPVLLDLEGQIPDGPDSRRG